MSNTDVNFTGEPLFLYHFLTEGKKLATYSLITNRGRSVRRVLERFKELLLLKLFAERLPFLESSPSFSEKINLLVRVQKVFLQEKIHMC